MSAFAEISARLMLAQEAHAAVTVARAAAEVRVRELRAKEAAAADAVANLERDLAQAVDAE